MKYLIIANGDFLPLEVLQEISKDANIIALDGAANKLMDLGIIPDYVLGDFDSITNKAELGVTEKKSEVPYEGQHGMTIVPRGDQNFTDLQKGIQYAKSQGATEIHLVCTMSETRLDHTISAQRCLRSEATPTCKIYLHTLGQSLSYSNNQTVTVKGKPGDTCGIMAFPEAEFTSSGLAYNGENYPLLFAHQDSCSNQLVEPEATITISGEALIIHPPMFPSQRLHASFKKKTK